MNAPARTLSGADGLKRLSVATPDQPLRLDRGRTLDPEFLATALELAEEVAFADGPDLASLRQRLKATCDDVFAELARACADDDYAAAARRLHESRYVRKALADLDARIQGAPA